MLFHPPRSPVLASALAAAGIVLTAASCSHVTPLGTAPAGTPTPAHAVTGSRALGSPVIVLLRQLGSPIILQVMRREPSTPAGGCPAGSVAVYVPKGAAPIGCYRPVGTPVTITSAVISPVSGSGPSPAPGQPAQYGFTVTVPVGHAAAVTALVTQAYKSRDALGVSAAGKLWEAPQVLQPFPGLQFQVAFLSKNQARQLYRILVPPS